MGFQDAIKVCLSKYVEFNGRARRSEYWYFTLFNFVVSMIAGFIDGILGLDIGIVGGLTGLALLLPGIAVSMRRLHDIGKSGWWLLLALIPIVGWIILIVFACQPGTSGGNAYGDDPKASAA
ncbi:MAG: hypothetical protein RL026_2201 [Pseudomonadota bacterium]|jgi:uncharacterized membrane protein YhaH (DUF805 family)